MSSNAIMTTYVCKRACMHSYDYMIRIAFSVRGIWLETIAFCLASREPIVMFGLYSVWFFSDLLQMPLGPEERSSGDWMKLRHQMMTMHLAARLTVLHDEDLYADGWRTH